MNTQHPDDRPDGPAVPQSGAPAFLWVLVGAMAALEAVFALAEAGVIGKPDEMAMEIVKAFVALKPGYQPGRALEREIMAHARRQLGPAVAPRSIAFRDDLPKTRSGKIMRRLLRARELGLPEGDTSTLEEST